MLRRMSLLNVILTGGPCGGKTSSLEDMSARLKQEGYDVYCVPEVPTILMGGGCRYPGTSNLDQLFEFEKHLMKVQLQMEDSFRGIAKSTGRKSVIIHDRGIMDVKTYLPEDLWNQILERNSWTEKDFHARYDAVVHLVTAADGASEFYTTANNSTRKETAEEAIALDRRTLKSWSSHPNVTVIENRGEGFKEKLTRATNAVLKSLPQ